MTKFPKPIWILTILLWLCAFSGARSQHDWVWTFGDSIYLSFPSGGNPIIDPGQTTVKFFEAAACYSDSNGNLLLYSNHDSVYNGSGIAMTNGFVPGGGSLFSITQGIVAIPNPQNPNTILEFGTNSNCPGPPIRCPFYLQIDPLQDTRGTVNSATMINNPAVSATLTEFMAPILHADGKSWWVFYHDINADFIKFFVDGSGVTNFGKQAIGSSHSIAGVGEMTFSPTGEHLVVVSLVGVVDLFDFDRCTGELGNWQSLGDTPPAIRGPHTYYGSSFSPDGTKLYVSEIWNDTTGNRLFQFDLAVPNIFASRTVVFQAPPFVLLGQHQLGPDGRIYLSHVNESNSQDSSNYFLSIIENPNQAGVGCNVNYLALDLQGRRSKGGLPHFPNYDLGPLLAQTAEAGPSHLICPGDSVQLGYPDSTNGLVSYSWTDGVGSMTPPDGLINSAIPQPWARPDTTTWYFLQVVDSAYGIPCGVTWDSVLVRVAMPEDQPNAMAGVDTIFCPGSNAPLGAADSAVSGWNYGWLPVAGVAAPSDPTTTTNLAGTYVLSVSNPIASGACFFDQDTVVVVQYDTSIIPPDLAGTDGVICQGDTVRLGLSNAPSGWGYQWSSPGSLDDATRSGPLAFPLASTTYTLVAQDNSVALSCAAVADSITILVEQPFSHPLPNPVIRFCSGECITIGVDPQPGFEYAWTPSIGLDAPHSARTRAHPQNSTTYTLTVTDPSLQSTSCRTQVFTVLASAENCSFPTFLWPNGDGIADALDFGEYDGNLELVIYDVQGRLVYSDQDYRNKWNGDGLAAGIYAYRLQLDGECGFIHEGKFLKMR